MDKEIFDGIVEGLKEAIAIQRGEIEPAEVIEIPDEPKQIRTRLKLSQAEFAEFVGVNEYTLKNWEQGKRRIPAPAKTLFKIAAAYPEIILKVRENDLKSAKGKMSARRRTPARKRLATA